MAKAIQNNLALKASDYGIQVQGVIINGVTVPSNLNTQFMQTINQAQNQVKTMVQDAQAYKAAIAPIWRIESLWSRAQRGGLAADNAAQACR